MAHVSSCGDWCSLCLIESRGGAHDPIVFQAKCLTFRTQRIQPLSLLSRRYEVPDIQFEKLAVRFMDIRKRVYDVSGMQGVGFWGHGQWEASFRGSPHWAVKGPTCQSVSRALHLVHIVKQCPTNDLPLPLISHAPHRRCPSWARRRSWCACQPQAALARRSRPLRVGALEGVVFGF